MKTRAVAAQAVALAVALAGCSYPATQMVPVERRGERLEAQLVAALERGDFAEAHAVCARKLELARRSGTMVNLVAVHETMLWIAWAEGELARALGESDAMAAYSRRAAGEQRRMGLVHTFWARAWLLAERGQAADAAVARDELARVSTQPGEQASLPVMDAWLALRRGDGAGAAAALAPVDVERDDGPQDLYIFTAVRRAQHDDAAATRLRRRIADGARSTMRALVLHRMANDAPSDTTASP